MNERYENGYDAVSGVYMVTNGDNKIIYIGESGNIPARFEQHRQFIESGIRPQNYSPSKFYYLVENTLCVDCRIFPVHVFETSTRKEREYLES